MWMVGDKMMAACWSATAIFVLFDIGLKVIDSQRRIEADADQLTFYDGRKITCVQFKDVQSLKRTECRGGATWRIKMPNLDDNIDLDDRWPNIKRLAELVEERTGKRFDI